MFKGGQVIQGHVVVGFLLQNFPVVMLGLLMVVDVLKGEPGVIEQRYFSWGVFQCLVIALKGIAKVLFMEVLPSLLFQTLYKLLFGQLIDRFDVDNILKVFRGLLVFMLAHFEHADPVP